MMVIELWRRPGRLAGVTVTMTALAALAVILVSLSSGLWAGATGAIGRSSADEFAFSRDSLGSFARSRFPLTELARVARLPGVRAAGALGTLTTAMSLPHQTVDVAVMGSQFSGPGAPPAALPGRLPRAGEDAAAVDVALRADGVRLGSWLRPLAGGPRLRVTGFVAAGQFELLPTVWTSLATWQALSAAAQPESSSSVPVAQVLTVSLTARARQRQVQDEVSAALGGATVIGRDQAMLAVPGAAAMRTTIAELIAAVLGVAAAVCALFSALQAAERRAELARLRALGASARRLGMTLLAQTGIPAILAVGAAFLLTAALLAAAPPQFPAALPLPDAAGTGALILLAAGAGAIVPVVRAASVDPMITMEEQ